MAASTRSGGVNWHAVRARQASRLQAMKVLAPTTLLTLHGDSLSAFRRIAEFVELDPALRA